MESHPGSSYTDDRDDREVDSRRGGVLFRYELVGHRRRISYIHIVSTLSSKKHLYIYIYILYIHKYHSVDVERGFVV